MSHEWREARLGDLVEISHGWAFKGEHFHTELTGCPIVVNVGNFRYTGGFRFAETVAKEYRANYPLEYELRPGDILLIMTCQTAGGEILGVPARVPDDGRIYLHNQRLGRVVVRKPDSVDPGFLYWLFLTTEFNRELVNSATGTKILHTAPARIEDFIFMLPPGDEQLAIARVLDALDDKVELNRRMSETLEEMARALFRSWFVDFDPVRAKAEGRDPGLPGPLADLFPSRFVDSARGEIPEGWEERALGDLADQKRRAANPAQIDSGTPYIGLEHMPRKSIALDNWVGGRRLESNKFRFLKGEILFGKLRPYFHKVGVAPVDGVCSTDIVVIAPRDPDWFGVVLGHVSSARFIEYADGASTGTKMPRTNWQDMARYLVALPPRIVARAYTSLMLPIVDRLVAGIHECRTLADMRDSLLPKLLSGELRVPVPEPVLEEAL